MAEGHSGFPKGVGAPAIRALVAAGYTGLAQLAGVSPSELMKLHGVGTKALRLIQQALTAQGKTLGKPPISADYHRESHFGDGHWVHTLKRGHKTETFSVTVARLSNTEDSPDLKRGRNAPRDAQLERDDLLFMLEAKKRDWRAHRASSVERENVLRIGRQLEQKELLPSEFAKMSFGLTPATYSRWKRGSR
jgi:hypothetical protein